MGRPRHDDRSDASDLAQKEYLEWQSRRVALMAFTVPAVVSVVGWIVGHPTLHWECFGIPLMMLTISGLMLRVFCQYSLDAKWFLIAVSRNSYLIRERRLEIARESRLSLILWTPFRYFTFNGSIALLYLLIAVLSWYPIYASRGKSVPTMRSVFDAHPVILIAFLLVFFISLLANFLAYRHEDRIGEEWRNTGLRRVR